MNNFDSVQQACDYAVAKIVEQGGQCLDEEGLCLYASEDGKHCAVGWLLNEKDPSKLPIDTALINLDTKLLPQVVLDNMRVFTMLQAFHDTASYDGKNNWLLELERLGINVSAPQYEEWLNL